MGGDGTGGSGRAVVSAVVPVQLYVGRKIADESITSDVRWITSSKLQTSRSRRQNLRNTRLVSREFHLCQSQDSERWILKIDWIFSHAWCLNLRIQITESQCRSAANVKIQCLNLVNFRLRFAANFKIQFWIPKIAPKIRSEIPVFRPRAPCKLQYLLTISRFRVLNTGNLHGARSKFSIFRRAWILKLSESRLGFYTRGDRH